MKSVVFGSLLAITLVTGCGVTHPAGVTRPMAVPHAKAAARVAEIAHATPADALKLLAADKTLQFVDVRQPDEFAAGRAKGTVNRPLPDLASWSATLDKQGHYLVICHSGRRSLQACTSLVAQGFTHVTNVDGGTMAWESAGLPMDR